MHIKGENEQWRIILGEIRQIEIVDESIHKSSEPLLVVFGGNNIW